MEGWERKRREKMKRKIVKITALAVIMWFSTAANATTVNWNAIEVNDIEYYMQTDKAVYNLGENVEMLYKVTNLSNANVTFSFGGDPEWNFWVEKDGENIWTAVQGWWLIGSGFTLSPNEFKEYTYEWNMQDNEEDLVNLGEYDVIGGLDGGTSISSKKWEFTEVAVPITIVPEPCSLTLFITGLYILNHFNEKRI